MANDQRILIVDDDPTLHRFAGEYLTNHGYVVLHAHDGPEALRIAYKEHPALVLLDVMMPHMDGWEVCARMREMSDVPIILLTAKSAETEKLRGFRMGIDDYVTKPYSLAELSARIQAVLSRARSKPVTERNLITYGDVIIDLDKRQAKRGDEEIPLTPTEYRLLEFLARNQGRAITEIELSQEIWGNCREESTGALRRYVFLLRQKIESDPAHPKLILTVRGYGYRMGTGSLNNPET
jgi:two-component system KDP operon response regulator KdpE